jgi:ankyrin repeat protein/beta-lactamase regulating signal transducer with metallopeptidase domain
MTPELAILLKATVALMFGLGAVALGSRARASVRHLVLASTLAMLVALPLVGAVVPALTLAVPMPATVAPSTGAASPARPRVAPNVDAIAAPVPASPIGGDAVVLPSLATLLRATWIAGTVLLFCVLAHALWKVARTRRSSIPWLAGQAVVDRLTASDPGVRGVSVVVHEDVPAPVTCGWRHPIVMFPADAQQWGPDDIERALVHELEHVRRGDWIVQLLARGVCAVYWFHPLVWMAWRRLCLECERACDDAVVDRMADTEYATQLVALAGRLAQSDPQPVLSMARRSDLTIRVKAVLDRTQLRGRAGTSAVAVALAVTAVFALILAPMRVQAVPASPAAARAASEVDAAGSAEDTAAEAEGPQRENRRPNRRNADRGDTGVRRGALGRALVEAAQQGSVEDVAGLLDAGADVNTVVEGDGTALLIAARDGDREMVDFLLQRGADVNIGVKGDGSALIMASREGYLDIVRTLLDRGGDIDLGVEGDGSALIMAAREGYLEIVRTLVERGGNVNVAVRGDGSPLIMASREGYLDIVRLLLDRGADIGQVVPGDENAIISASEGGHLRVVQFLVSRGADVNSRVWAETGWPDRRGEWRTPLSQARRNGHTRVVEYLRSVGARD